MIEGAIRHRTNWFVEMVREEVIRRMANEYIDNVLEYSTLETILYQADRVLKKRKEENEEK